MRFKQQQNTQLPEVDLIPMLNVMMGILAFFVMITMTLSGQQSIDVQLPPEKRNSSQPAPPADLEPFIVELGLEGELWLNAEPIERFQLEQAMQTYLEQNPKHAIFLKPDLDLTYEEVAQFLGEMRIIGGDRVALAVE
ncbi:MAG: biopolymer transporter ExbD [Cyanothece sp. SIO1E1]|nr:biopolymer transporter ExbD [Cyanothece sp. SIO1E1]